MGHCLISNAYFVFVERKIIVYLSSWQKITFLPELPEVWLYFLKIKKCNHLILTKKNTSNDHQMDLMFFFILQPSQKKHNIYIIGFSLNEIKKQSYVEMLFGICNLSEKEILWTTFKDFSSIWRRGEHFHINTNKNLPM